MDNKDIEDVRAEIKREVARKPLPVVMARELGGVGGNMAIVSNDSDETKLALKRDGRWFISVAFTEA